MVGLRLDDRLDNAEPAPVVENTPDHPSGDLKDDFLPCIQEFRSSVVGLCVIQYRRCCRASSVGASGKSFFDLP
jgi:hypothetical protein